MEIKLDGIKGALHPGPGTGHGPQKTPKLPSLAKGAQEVALSLSQRKVWWSDDLEAAEELQRHTRAIKKRWIGKTKPDPRVTLDAEREGVAVAMFAMRHPYVARPHPGPKLLRYHVVAAGLPLALEAQIRGAGYRYTYERASLVGAKVKQVKGARFGPGLPHYLQIGFDKSWKPLSELRARLAGASDEEVAGCEAVVERLWEELSVYQKAVAAYLLPSRPQLATEASTLEVIDPDRNQPRQLHDLLLHSLTDPERVAALIGEHEWGLDGRLAPAVLRIGAPLVPPLLESLERGTRRHRQELAGVLGRFGDQAVTERLCAMLAEEKLSVESIRPHLLWFPELTLPVVESLKLDAAREVMLEAHPELNPDAGPVATQDQLPEALRGEVSRALPEYWTPSAWTTLTLKSGEVLPLSALERLTEAMLSASGRTTPTLVQIRDALDEKALAAFLFDALEALDQDYRARDPRWLVRALGPLLGDAAVERLGVYARRQTGNRYRKAIEAVGVLEEMDSDRAVLQIGLIAAKHKTRGVKKDASQRLKNIARRRGLTQDELADRLVPTLGLDEGGRMTLDYGPRRFEVRFDEALRPLVIDEKGKVRQSPPKPGKRDDQELAGEALAAFKQLKKDVKAVAQTQVWRLEQALINGRRWRRDEAARYVYRHALLGHLGRRLLWAWSGGLFRVDEQGELVDCDDEPVALPGDAQVWLGHPLDMSEEERQAWKQHFADYELVPPFAQLGRPVFRPGEEATEALLESLRGLVVPAGRVRGLLNEGWTRLEVGDGGNVFSFSRQLDETHLVLELDAPVSIHPYQGERDAKVAEVVVRQPGHPRSFSEAHRELATVLRG